MIAVSLFLLGSAMADEQPAKPLRPDDFPFECRSAIGITAETRAPYVDRDGLATCSGVLLPTSEAYYLQKIKTWSFENDAFLKSQIAQKELDLAKAKGAVLRSRKTTQWVSVASALMLSGFSIYISQIECE